MRGILDEFYAGITMMIPDPRARQPREEEMKCGSQSADVRMIHRRSHLLRVAFLIQCHGFFSNQLNRSCLHEKTPCLRLTPRDMSKIPRGRQPDRTRLDISERERWQCSEATGQDPPLIGKIVNVEVDQPSAAFYTGVQVCAGVSGKVLPLGSQNEGAGEAALAISDVTDLSPDKTTPDISQWEILVRREVSGEATTEGQPVPGDSVGRGALREIPRQLCIVPSRPRR